MVSIDKSPWRRAFARTPLCVLWVFLTLDAGSLADVQATFYVAPDGSDRNPGTEAEPFATIDRARIAARTVRRPMTGDVVVVLAGGVYAIDRPLVFQPEDSGTDTHDVIYRAKSGATPILSGGKHVVDWKPDSGGRWKAASPAGDFRQLYVNGVRATRARGAPPGDLTLLGENRYTTRCVAMAGWRNAGDIEICYQVVWCHTRCKVRSITREGDSAVVTMLEPHFTHARTKEGAQITPPPNVPVHRYLENAFELLDQPGEWYLDRPGKTVYYMPCPGEDMTRADVIVPTVERLIELRGSLDRPVHNIRFEGIAFEHGGWLLPNKIGLVDVQANFLLDWKNPWRRGTWLTAVHNEQIKSPSNIVCRAAKSIRFERCTFSKLGSGGIDLEYGAENNTISGCRFYDISGSAIQVGDVLRDDHHPDDPRKIVRNNAIVNNRISDCCKEYMGGVGVFVGYANQTLVAHNEITRLPYSAISVGWGWGEEDAGGGGDMPFGYSTPTPAGDNRIEYNDIHDIMQCADDGAGIYTLGDMPGTAIRGNHIYDNRDAPGGIYLDQGSGFLEISGNLVHGVRVPIHYNNDSRDRRATCKEHDNVFGEFPAAAKPIAAKAGLESEYRDLRRCETTPTFRE